MNYYVTYSSLNFQLCAIDDSGNYFLGTPSLTLQLAVSDQLESTIHGVTTIEERCSMLNRHYNTRNLSFYYVGPYSSPSEIISNHPELLL